MINPQGVGEHYNKDDFRKSQALGWQILNALKDLIRPGIKESEGYEFYKKILNQFELEKNWHPPKIRFGPNSIKSFREVSDADYQLKENDIFFLDIGPIINGYESDVGKTFVVGDKQINNLYKKIIADAEDIFALTKKSFLQDQLKGAELYQLAENHAKDRGWLLVGEGANGHRIGDFPHHGFYKGNLRDFKHDIVPDMWILEIQLRSPDLKFGAFFEDIL